MFDRQLEGGDLVRVTVTAAPGGQRLRAVVDAVYSAREFDVRPGRTVEFVAQPAHFGQRGLLPGQRAFVFLRRISGRWYEHAWNGDLPIEVLDGAEYACHRVPYATVTAAGGAVPARLRENCRPHPGRPSTVTCFAYGPLERHLVEEIAARGLPTAPPPRTRWLRLPWGGNARDGNTP